MLNFELAWILSLGATDAFIVAVECCTLTHRAGIVKFHVPKIVAALFNCFAAEFF